jgi:PAS domain S-box-containing protein
MLAASSEEQVVIVAPLGQDASRIATLLRDRGFEARVCAKAGEVCSTPLSEVGALVLTEEALDFSQNAELFAALRDQPSWSELPLIILTRGGEPRTNRLLDLAASAAGSVTLLERPLSSATLLRSIEVALRSRRRQYQVRDLLAEKERRQRQLEEANTEATKELAERKRAEESLARRAREQAALYEFTDLVHRAGSLEDIYQAALDAIAKALDCERASLLLFDDSGSMQFVAWRGLSDQYRNAVKGHSPWQAGARDSHPIPITDVEAEKFPAALSSALRAERIRSLAFIPLRSGETLVGKFMTYYEAPHRFTPQEMDLALALARQIGFGVERKRAEQALQESEERYRTLVAQVKDYAIFRTDLQGRPKSWNEGVRRVLGFEQPEFLASEMARIFTPEDVHAGVPEHELEEAAKKGQASNDRWLRRADGTRFFASGVTTGLRNSAGELVGFSKVLRDNTALAMAQAKLEEHAVELEGLVAARTQDLQAINEQLEAFVYSIAHDLRTPLRTVTGFSQMLQEDYAGQLEPTAHQLLRRIHAASEFMDRLLLDLLAFGRTARAPMDLGPVEVRKALDTAVFQCLAQIEQTQAHVEVQTPLPSVLAHEATLGQCLANLVSNAIKFVAPGVLPKIRLRTEEHGEKIQIWVEDNGLGIPRDQQERIFRVFERLHGARYTGTGIGLSIVRKGVERMGGRVGLESEPGQGSHFWIELPKAP